MRQQLLEALRSHADGQIAKHKANVEVYLHQVVGIGEHSDIVTTLELEIEQIAKYEEQLQVLDKYFK